MPSNDATYISVDVEASGPIPGPYSLLSIGACLVDDPAHGFYVELQPIGEAFTEEALRVSGLSMAALRVNGAPPTEAMRQFADWVARVTCGGSHAVMVGFNVAFDWAFVNDYFLRYLGHNPFGHAPVDIKSFYMGLSGVDWRATAKMNLPPRYMGGRDVPHHALEDARLQAEAFRRMLAEARKTAHLFESES